MSDEDFSTAHLIVRTRECEYALMWSGPRGHYSMTYPTFDEANEKLEPLTRSPSIVSASIWRGDECLARYAYDPYAWHDVRKAVGR